jgi:hypothetical protein
MVPAVRRLWDGWQAQFRAVQTLLWVHGAGNRGPTPTLVAGPHALPRVAARPYYLA